jgi:CII-binding regulator of phage lambda lysogenization HflD
VSLHHSLIPAASLSEELVHLTSQLNSASTSAARLAAVDSALTAMTRRHDAACLIIAELNEEIEEIKEDAQQAKEVFKEQLTLIAAQTTAPPKRV